MRTILPFIFLYFFNLIPIIAQTVFEPLDSDVYSFLDKQAVKGLIELHDEFKPISRKYITELLIEIENNKDQLSNLEQEELVFYKKEFGLELELFDKDISKHKSLTLFRYNKFKRFSLFTYTDSRFKLNVDPILGFGYSSKDDKINKHFWNGLTFHGYIGENIGFYFYFRDNHESGTYFDTLNELNSKRKITVAKKGKDFIEYSDTRGGLTYNWVWGEATIGKDYISIGNAESGNVILSDNAPSFPFLSLDVQPTEWLRFRYFHSWLVSDIVDSSSAYETFRNGIFRIKLRPKFMALHSVSVYPLKGLSFTFGESIVYSERFEYIYLIPVIFFRLADHYASNYNNHVGNNAQIFFSFSLRNHIPNTSLYGSLFIDDLSVTNIFNRAKQRNKVGITLGLKIEDLPINNLSLVTEYTRINPYVYTHFVQTLTYENSSNLLGHWLGQNADLIYLGIKYKLMRGFNLKVWSKFIRKGGKGDMESAQRLPQPSFLFGLRKSFTNFGFEMKYEILHRLTARLTYKYSKLLFEDKPNLNKKSNEMSFSIYYGL